MSSIAGPASRRAAFDALAVAIGSIGASGVTLDVVIVIALALVLVLVFEVLGSSSFLQATSTNKMASAIRYMRPSYVSAPRETSRA